MNITNVSAGNVSASPQMPNEKGEQPVKVNPEGTPESGASVPTEKTAETPATTVQIGDKPVLVKETKAPEEPAVSVEIGKPQVQEKAVSAAGDPAVTVQIGKQSQKIDAGQTRDAAKVETKTAENVFQSVLDDVGKAIETRSAVLKAMPPEVREMAQDILGKSLADTSTISEGMIATIRAEKSAVDQLQNLTSTLADAEQLTKQVPEKTLNKLPDLLKNFDAEFTKLLQDTNTVPKMPEEKPALGLMTENQLDQAMATNKPENTQSQMPQAASQSSKPGSEPLKATLQSQETTQASEPQIAANNKSTELQQHANIKDRVAQAVTDTRAAKPQLNTNNKVSEALVSNTAVPQNASAASPEINVNQYAQKEQNTNGLVQQPAILDEPYSASHDIQAAPRQSGEAEMSMKQANQQLSLPEEHGQVKDQFNSNRMPETEPNSNNAVNNGQVSTQESTAKTGVLPQMPEKSQLDIKQLQTATPDQVSNTVKENNGQTLENDVINIGKQLAGNNPDDAVKNNVKQFIEQSALKSNAGSAEEAVLKKLVENYTKDAPEMLKYAAAKNNLPELPQLWALVKLNKALEWTKLEQEKLQETIRSLREMTASMKKSIAFTGEKADNTSSLSFSMPLYLGEGMQPYPAYIHVYHQRERDARENGGEYKYETWLRICLQTENIGPVDMVFRLYQENLLNVKVAFRAEDAAQGFSTYLPDIREALDESSLNLVEVSVNAKPDLGG